MSGLLALSVLVGRSAANNLMESGDPFPQGTISTLSRLAVGIRARPVTIEWSGATPRPNSIGANDEVILLGRNEGIIVLYNRTTRKAVRVAGSSSLTLNAEGPG